MNKKAYIKPETTVVAVETEYEIMLGSSASIKESDNSITIDLDNILDDGDASQAASKHHNVWD